MSAGVSVVVCCHNSAKRLPETLRHLALQIVPAAIPWEVVIIDNASTDQTAATARECWPAQASAPLRIVAEPKQGLANARFRSYVEARYDFISFIDDDNWVGPDWVANVFQFFSDHPDAAAVGGPSRAAFEQDPPAWFWDYSGYYAIGDQNNTVGEITDRTGTLLWGAGMSVRRELGLELRKDNFRILLCGGDDFSIQTGEDSELGFALRALGGRIYYEPKLPIQHFMPADRLTWPKALKLMYTMGEASPIIELYLIALDLPPYRQHPAWRKSWLFNLLKTGKDQLFLFISHPVDCLRKPEGSRPVLEFERNKGRWATLWKLCGRYAMIRDRIRHAPWVRARA